MANGLWSTYNKGMATTQIGYPFNAIQFLFRSENLQDKNSCVPNQVVIYNVFIDGSDNWSGAPFDWFHVDWNIFTYVWYHKHLT